MKRKYRIKKFWYSNEGPSHLGFYPPDPNLGWRYVPQVYKPWSWLFPFCPEWVSLSDPYGHSTEEEARNDISQHNQSEASRNTPIEHIEVDPDKTP